MSLVPLLALLFHGALLPQDAPASTRVAIVTPPTLHWDPAPGLFDAFTSGCRWLRWTPEGLCALGEDSCYLLDLESAKAGMPDGVYGRGRVQDIVAWDGRFARLIVGGAAELTVEAVSRAGVHGLSHPGSRPELSSAEVQVGIGHFPFLAAHGDRLLVLTGTTLFSYEDAKWSSMVLDISDNGYAPPVSRTLLDGTTLYIGTDRGEWGGELLAADIRTGVISRVSANWPEGFSNVADLDRGPDGRIWVTHGCAHMDGHGDLYAQSGDAWEHIATTTHDYEDLFDCRPEERPDIVLGRTKEKRVPAELPPTGFVALDFDPKGRPVLLTETHGLFRREADGTWRWLTRGWPVWRADATDLAIVGDRAVVSSASAGVIVIDLDTLAARRVRLLR